jgi:hypothetical protein
MSAHHHHHKHGADSSGGRPAHTSYWRFAHRDWRFWAGLILIFTAMFIYLMTEDLSFRPRLQPVPPSSQTGVGK